jgi:Polyketide cyclase / dehydrase and lipid transport
LRAIENQIEIQAISTNVERCLAELDLLHRWLNPLLRCHGEEGVWSTSVGAIGYFTLQVPILLPTLQSTVVEREPGLIVWGFDGFFVGRDRWECQPIATGTRLINRFEFEIPNPLIEFGFDRFAAAWTQADMQAQLRRFKQVAESL